MWWPWIAAYQLTDDLLALTDAVLRGVAIRRGAVLGPGRELAAAQGQAEERLNRLIAQPPPSGDLSRPVGDAYGVVGLRTPRTESGEMYWALRSVIVLRAPAASGPLPA